jgi:uncharacterized membrane protein
MTLMTFDRKFRASQIMLLALPLCLAACQSGDSNGASVPGNRADEHPSDLIAKGDTLHFIGTEPFWGGEVAGDILTYRTPEEPEGQRFPISRFDGRGGLSYSGSLNGAPFTIAITAGTCSDGMSERAYPFVATLKLGDQMRNGCAWSEAQPFTGPKAP